MLFSIPKALRNAARYFFPFLAFFILCVAADRSEADQTFLSGYLQTLFSEDSDIHINNANEVIQTADGYIWIATYGGLIRYDGKSSKVYGESDGFPTSNVTALMETPDGNLWIGTNDAGVVLYKDNAFTVFGSDRGMPASSVRALTHAPDGTVYASTPFGIARIAPDLTLEPLSVPGRDNVFAKDIVRAQNGELWCVLDEGGILVLNESGVVREYAPRELFGLDIESIFQASDGTFYFGTTANKVIVHNEQEEYFIDTSYLSTVNGLYEDSEGRIWVCADSGTGYIDNYSFRRVDGLIMESSIENIFEDYEGGFWLSSSRKGVLHLTRGKFQNLSFAWNLPELTVNTTCVYGENLYVGADEGLFVFDMEGNAVSNDLTAALEGIRIRAVVGDSKGNLWICTYKGYGIIRWREDGTFVSITEKQGLPSNRVRCVAEALDGRIVAGTGEGVGIIEDDRVVRSYTKEDGLHNAIILSLAIDDRGVIYAGSDGGGIYRIDEDEVRNISEADGLTSGIVLRVSWDPFYKGVWVSMGNGVGFWTDRDGFRNIGRLGDYGASVFDFKHVGYDELWLLASSGVHICQKQSLFASDSPLDIMTFDRHDGLVYSVTANSWSHLTERGDLILACNQGIISTNANRVYRTTTPKIAVSSVVVDDVKYENPKRVVVPPRTRRLTINFSMLSFASTRGNRVEAFLEGFDSEPSLMPTDSVTQVSYTNLKGGEYTFRMRGINREGAESEELSLPIYQEYRPVERLWVQAAILAGTALLILLATTAVHRHKTKQLIRRQQEYRAITEQAIMAIADTIDAKDKYTSGHSKRVAQYALEIAQRLDMSQEECENLYYTALLHDIGKIGLEDSILNKNDRLTDEEYAKMKRHVDIGGDILKSITVVDNIATGAKYHHERFDGLGYTQGLTAMDIPLFARIICVADAYDAMSTDRPYRKALSKEQIVEEIARCAGAQFDEKIARCMLDIIRS